MTKTLNEKFWEIVDANWTHEEIHSLVRLCKSMEVPA